MEQIKLTGHDLLNAGFPEGKVIGVMLRVLEAHYSEICPQEQLELMRQVFLLPEDFENDKKLGPIAVALIKKKEKDAFNLSERPKDYSVYGAEGIEPGAIRQMRVAMRLPVTHSGALMPDAHEGYGLPIGGVMATNNAVVPYAVGVDIGCRMCLSVYDIPGKFLDANTEKLKKMLTEYTRFGFDAFAEPMDDPVFARSAFDDIHFLKSQNLKDKAYAQIGTSGGGNHFVEFGIVEITGEDNPWGLQAGRYVAVLSHSGSRGFGANIAKHYSKLARKKSMLPDEARHLAWLGLDTDDGKEYWAAMSLAGEYAEANHRHIHHRLALALGEDPLFKVENHHNFAWKELSANGEEIIVHRKGATPAGEGVLGIIPGSMASPGFVVRGKGNPQSLQSASHGAGRVLSRKKALTTLSQQEFEQYIRQAGITLIGSGLDESPMVYKDIHQVMEHQKDLVEVLAAFHPKIVRMDGDDLEN